MSESTIWEIRWVLMGEECDGFIPEFIAMDRTQLQRALLEITEQHNDVVQALMGGSLMEKITFRVPSVRAIAFDSDILHEQWQIWEMQDDKTPEQIGAMQTVLPADRDEFDRVRLTDRITIWKDGTICVEIEHKNGLDAHIELN